MVSARDACCALGVMQERSTAPAGDGSGRVTRVLAVLVAAAVLGACGTGERPQTPQPRDGRAGLQLSGTVAGAQVAVSDGSPDLLVGACGESGSGGGDLCVVSRDLRGGPVIIAVRNPGVLVAGRTVGVGDPGCAGPACDDVTDVAVVEVLIGDGFRQRAVGGAVAVTVVEEARRYAGRLRLQLPDGTLSGHFDVVPRPR